MNVKETHKLPHGFVLHTIAGQTFDKKNWQLFARLAWPGVTGTVWENTWFRLSADGVGDAIRDTVDDFTTRLGGETQSSSAPHLPFPQR